MVDMKELYKNLEDVLMVQFDKGYEEGLTPEFMFFDLADHISTNTEYGQLTNTVPVVRAIYESWRESRGIA